LQQDISFPPYVRFADIYDKIGSDDFSLRMLRLAQRLLWKYKAEPSGALDLACGTGSAALAMARRGITCTGLDISAEMLAKAREKAAGEPGLPVNFVEGDMRRFSLPLRVDLITCFFDAMNYILRDEDLQATFHCVNAHLAPGGFFIFDMNSVHALEHIWGNNTYTEDFGDVTYIWQNEYEPITRTGTLTAVFFAKADERNLYEKYVEVHIERGYYIHEVKQYLKKAGLDLLEVVDPHGQPADESTNRQVYVARKPQA